MDRRIPPESPPVPVRNEALELKVKQGMQREAFDSALQRAGHRRTMDSRDRVVAAGVKQAQAAPGPDGQFSQLTQPRSELGAFSMLKSSQWSEQFDVEHVEPGTEFAHTDFMLKALSGELAGHRFTTGSTRLLSDESLAMLFKKIQSSEYQCGECIVLELVDDPSGVMQIRLTHGQSNRWAVSLVLTPLSSGGSVDESDLLESLMAQLQQSGISVDTVSVEHSQTASKTVVSTDG